MIFEDNELASMVATYAVVACVALLVVVGVEHYQNLELRQQNMQMEMQVKNMSAQVKNMSAQVQDITIQYVELVKRIQRNGGGL